MKELYLEKTFHSRSRAMIGICDNIIAEFANKGFKLTIRQLYYQLVARGHIENTVRSYDNTVALMTNARLAGLIDWDAIEDRTRDIIQRSSWSSGGSILQACAQSYHQDMWMDQPFRVFLIVEKEALAGVFEHICHQWDIPLLPARGYPSATTLRDMAKRRIMGASQHIVILHFGDHDPSGIDMTRDLRERLELFSRNRTHIEFRRVALNMDQVEEQSPPPNPAKTTDSRYESYRQQFGDESWELDALSPEYLTELVEREVQPLIDWEAWGTTKDQIGRVKEKLNTLADNFDGDVTHGE